MYRKNVLKDRLRSGEKVLGCWTMLGSAQVVEKAAVRREKSKRLGKSRRSAAALAHGGPERPRERAEHVFGLGAQEGIELRDIRRREGRLDDCKAPRPSASPIRSFTLAAFPTPTALDHF